MVLRAPLILREVEPLLVSRSGSSMRKSFALCEAFGLTPFPLSAGTGRPGRDTAVSGGEGEDLKEAGGLRPPASFKTSPSPG